MQRDLGYRPLRILIAAGLSIVTFAPAALARDLAVRVTAVEPGRPLNIVQADDNDKRTASVCKVSGCSREVCADRAVFTPCIWNPEFGCYKKAICEVQPEGKCGWTVTTALKACLRRTKGSLSGRSNPVSGSPPN